MPCYDSRDHDDALANAREVEVLRNKLNAATRAACEILQFLRDGIADGVSQETREWIQKHEEEDERRRLNALLDDADQAARG